MSSGVFFAGLDQAYKRRIWLPRMDSNHGFQLQRLTCYHYTTGQRDMASCGKKNAGRLFILAPWTETVKQRHAQTSPMAML